MGASKVGSICARASRMRSNIGSINWMKRVHSELLQNVTRYLSPLGVFMFLIKQQVNADTRGHSPEGIAEAHVFISLVRYLALDDEQIEI